MMVTDSHVSSLSLFRLLHTLCLRHADVSDLGLKSLPSSLRELCLDGCGNISDTGLVLLTHSVPKLETLCLFSCQRLKGMGLGALSHPTTSLNLTSLVLHNLRCLDDYRFTHCIKPGLCIRISRCSKVEDPTRAPRYSQTVLLC
jgi:hypothetical protein